MRIEMIFARLWCGNIGRFVDNFGDSYGNASWPPTWGIQIQANKIQNTWARRKVEKGVDDRSWIQTNLFQKRQMSLYYSQIFF